MDLGMLALTGAIPALVAMWVFDRLDAKRPEPRNLLRAVAFAGACSTIPIILLHRELGVVLVGTYESAALNGFVMAGLIEEAAKLLCVFAVVWRHPQFDERVDGIVYAARAGLGFALVENVLYISHFADSRDFIAIWVGRALLAVPGHAIWAGFMGYFLARRRFDKRGPGVLGGLAVAVFLHGVYDFFLFAAPAMQQDLGTTIAYTIAFGIPICSIIGGALVLRRLARRAIAADDRDEALRIPTPSVANVSHKT